MEVHAKEYKCMEEETCLGSLTTLDLKEQLRSQRLSLRKSVPRRMHKDEQDC
jgi:hypothetical protein